MKKSKTLKLLVALLLLLLVFSQVVILNITGGWEGVYLLSTKDWHIEVTDDIFPEDAAHYIAGVPFGTLANHHHRINANNSKLFVSWNSRKGRGSIKNEFSDGSKFLINLSRFKTPEGIMPSGAFIGGGLSKNDPDYTADNRNETGMAFFDGKRWFHIWCSINEAFATPSHADKVIGPDQWKFLSSKVIEKSFSEVTIESRHLAVVDGVPVKIEKYLFYEAGNSFCTVVTRIINVGDKPVTIMYMFGDEPWLGNYGSSQGNVGWTRDGLVKSEQFVNVNTTTYAGFFDYGNDLAAEQHTYTMKANFIEWERTSRPDSAYYSNFIGHFSLPAIDNRKVVLSSKDCRFLGLQWKKTLEPDQEFSFTLAIGMAENDPVTGFPKKPLTGLNH